MIDIEALRNEKLIEERENYENDFISIEDIMKSDELDYYCSPLFEEYFDENFETGHDFNGGTMTDIDYSFDFEDSLIKLCDEKLIEEREAYEKDYFEHVDWNLVDNDIFDFQIESHEMDECPEEYAPDYDYGYPDYEYDHYEEEMFYHLLYLKRSQFASPECGCYDLDYMPHDDGFCDDLDCYDYLDGPDENLCGIRYY